MTNEQNSRTLGELLQLGRSIWGERRTTASIGVAITLGVVYGDICRSIRDNKPADLAAEIGNVLLSTIRWCDDLGIDFEDALALAQTRQQLFVQRNRT